MLKKRGAPGAPRLQPKPSSGKVSFPRDWSRVTEDQLDGLKQFVEDGRKVVGKSFTTNSGSVVPFSVNIPQIGKLFLGFSFLDKIPGSLSVSINNEKFIDSVDPGYFVRNSSKDEFSPFPRPLGGLDQIKFELLCGDSASYSVAVYYI